MYGRMACLRSQHRFVDVLELDISRALELENMHYVQIVG